MGGVGVKTGMNREGIEGDQGINTFDFPGLLDNGLSTGSLLPTSALSGNNDQGRNQKPATVLY